jgi:DNA-binding HxlR family transcriptional regulator
VFSDENPSSPPSMFALRDLLGRRWARRILWQLRLAPASFQALRARCDSMSTSVRMGLAARALDRREPGGSG